MLKDENSKFKPTQSDGVGILTVTWGMGTEQGKPGVYSPKLQELGNPRLDKIPILYKWPIT